MGILDTPIATLEGETTTLGGVTEGKVALVVNVASKCGLTPQYTGLEELQKELGARGFTVVGVPCNQFMGQEPGSAEEILEFCSTTYGVTFPLTEKIDVNGPDRHPLYDVLAAASDAEGTAGDVQWNFEKFLLSAEGAIVGRFRPQTDPHDPNLIAAIESVLPK
ncbi:glutathione peroxidase [Embleya sp. NBC_00896]|uniref:glutathione peroxidase n=1 Tax=Embleya sp. NBC_00896 TaxID=2975961 RepID=UPI00386872A4|nr:glutathione peroxidase [Embleya sp. NBC_00896]